MKAMLLRAVMNLNETDAPLEAAKVPPPEPGADEVRIRVHCCGVCHTELDEIEGRMPPPQFPVIPGHQVVGIVDALGPGTGPPVLQIGQRVGVAWIYSSCGHCACCLRGEENLCPSFRATGRDVNGGYAEYMTVPAAFAHPIPEALGDLQAAPLLCAGAIGYRSLRLSGVGDGDALGLTGFGASGHLMLKMIAWSFPRTKVYVFARNSEERSFALQLGAVWAGDTADPCPVLLDAIIDTTPAWKPIVEALAHLRPGGRLVVNAIRKEEADKQYLLGLRYEDHLWMEKEIKSVANVARRDVSEFLSLAAEASIQPRVEVYSLGDANRALIDLKRKANRGAKVLQVR